MANLLTALGIPLLSSVKAKKLTNFYPNLAFFLCGIQNGEWEKIKDILGEETQKSLKTFFQKPANLNMLKELEKIANFSLFEFDEN